MVGNFVYKVLNRVRLTHLFFILFCLFFITLYYLERLRLTPSQLGLFGVTGFLFGYYFAPLYAGQKERVEKMAEIVREEALSVYDILTQTHLLEPADRVELKHILKGYLSNIVDNPKIAAENKDYDNVLKFMTQERLRSNSAIADVYRYKVSALQQHRDTLSRLYSDRIYSNEWITALVLFMINIFFVVEIDYGKSLLFNAMAAALCASLSMLIFILAKYSTLTHKEAKHIWDPIKTILRNNFGDVK